MRDRLNADKDTGHVRAQERGNRPGGVVAVEISPRHIEHCPDLTGVLRERDYVDDIVEGRSGSLEKPTIDSKT